MVSVLVLSDFVINKSLLFISRLECLEQTWEHLLCSLHRARVSRADTQTKTDDTMHLLALTTNIRCFNQLSKIWRITELLFFRLVYAKFYFNVSQCKGEPKIVVLHYFTIFFLRHWNSQRWRDILLYGRRKSWLEVAILVLSGC